MVVAKQHTKRATRKSVQQSAWIVLEGGFAARPCTVIDLSDSGAKIRVDDPSSVNSKLRLSFSRDSRKGRSCEVAWRRGNTLGLKFCRR
jgi:PilZ domain